MGAVVLSWRKFGASIRSECGDWRCFTPAVAGTLPRGLCGTVYDLRFRQFTGSLAVLCQSQRIGGYER